MTGNRPRIQSLAILATRSGRVAPRVGLLGGSDCPPLSPAPSQPGRGFSLLEVILAIAILAGAMVILGELVRIGTRASAGARDLTQAQLLCDSIMAEVITGAAEPDPVTRAAVPNDADWVYTIELAPTDEEGLVRLRVTVEQNVAAKNRPLSFSLVRWMADPGIELPAEEEQPEQPQQPDTSASPDDSGGGADER